jgi:hypothetical protein
MQEHKRYLALVLAGAAEDLGVELALDDCPESADIAYIDVVRGLRKPSCPAAVIADICRLVGVKPPAVIRQALG